MEIFKLFGSILVDSEQADKSIHKTDENAKGLASSLGSGLKTIGKAAAGIATAAAGAATAAGAALNSLVNDTATYADTIDKASFRSGLEAENLQRVKYAAEQSGASLDNIEKSAKKLNERLGEVSEGNEKSAEMFDKLGVSIYDAEGNMRSTDEIYNEVLLKLADMGDTAEATAVGTDLFGKAFTDLKPLLAAGSEGITDLMGAADELGLVMSQDAVTAGVAYGDTMADVKNSLDMAKKSIGSAVLPMFQKVATYLRNALPRIQNFVKMLIPIIEDLAESIIDPLMDIIDDILPDLMDFVESLIPPITDLIRSVVPVLVELLNKLAPIFTKIVEKLLPPLMDILDALMPLFELTMTLLDPILDLILGLIDPIADIIKRVEPLVTMLVGLIDDALSPIKDELDKFAPFLNNVLGVALESIAQVVAEVVMPALDGIIKFFHGDFEGGWQGLGEAFVGVFETTFSAIDDIFGTHLSEWYMEVQDFWGGVGSKLYEITHGDDIKMAELDNKYVDLSSDFGTALNKNLRAGLSAEDALEQTKRDVLNTSEALYYFNERLADLYTLDQAKQRKNNINMEIARTPSTIAGSWYEQYYKEQQARTPHLASGGIAYGKTQAIIGDNRDAAINPEVVAPLDELQQILAGALAGVGRDIAAAVKAASSDQARPMEITVRLSDDTELTRAIIRNINDCTRQDGVCVIKGV